MDYYFLLNGFFLDHKKNSKNHFENVLFLKESENILWNIYSQILINVSVVAVSF